MSDPTADIRAAIETALAERRARVEDLERRDAGFSNLRLATVVAALLVGVAGVVVDGRLMAGLGVAALAFVIVVFRHADLLRELERARRAVSFQERRLAVESSHLMPSRFIMRWAASISDRQLSREA